MFLRFCFHLIYFEWKSCALVLYGIMTLILIAVIFGLMILVTVLPIIMPAYVKLTYDSRVNRGIKITINLDLSTELY